MTVITKHPHQELFSKLPEIDKKDIKSDTFTQIGSSMLEVLEKRGGIGLSANQVGLTLRMCVINLDKPLIMLNPRIIKMSDKMVKSQEGCLSLPGATAVINRHKSVTVEYEDVTGETQTEETTGLFSCCVQHEIDHLNGILMINRLTEFAKSKFLKTMHRHKKTGRLK